MTPITEALHACASGILTAEAAVSLLSNCGSWLHRDDFTSQFITYGTSDGTLIAAIDWGAAITALQVGELPCSGGERRILQLSASLAAGTTVSLRDTVIGLDQDNAARLTVAIRHAAGNDTKNADINDYF